MNERLINRRLLEAAGAAESVPPTNENGQPKIAKPPKDKALADNVQAGAPVPGPILTCMADVEPRAISWLWPGRIPLGRITLLVGRPGEGKSFLAVDAAARVSTGTPWPDGSECPTGSAILISAEDDPADTIRPRLDAHCADVRRVHLLASIQCFDRDGHHERMVTLADLDSIEEALSRVPDCRLIVIDPIGSFLGGRIDSHRDNEVRSVLAPIARLAAQYGPAVLTVCHRRKSPGTSADDLALGSRAFTGIARSVLHLSRDPGNKSRRLLLPGKNNLASEGDGLAFAIVGEPPRIAWERDPVSLSADEALATENADRRGAKPGPEADALAEAVDWLGSALAAGPRPAKELYDAWRHECGGGKRTLERAKQTLKIVAFREAVPGAWLWRLANTANTANTAKQKELGDLGGLAKNTGNSTDFAAANRKTAKFDDLGGVADTEGGVRLTI